MPTTRPADAPPPACRAYDHKGREQPPCKNLKHFLVQGDAACTSDYHYCFDCQRVWAFTDCTLDPGPNWDAIAFEVLKHPSFWRHGLTENYFPTAAFADLPASFEGWIRGLKEPEYAVGPT